ncbi:VOC family protein [Cellulomonas xylanilytica]|uniref:Glyoxalase-like domain-containing protein n=1 Tax=Cellulomonas xylanilytica TaxID=233583 RepID=A0A510VD08_9CELL|nr:VOC family protein [Cellulomonas xylanilytica]GEK23035.1 hypothetical protein CXY01_35550 [Cellulomonas xylanilytica]
MTSRLVALVVEAHDPARLARFWADLLGRTSVEDSHGVLVPGSATQLGLRFVASTSARVGPDRMHLHLTSTDPADQQHTVDRALDLGARHLDVGQRPDEGHVVLADPEGYALCVIEPGTAFLAGCGALGEVTCAGSRAVGLFWAATLGWPLVWDNGAETAVQSPRGGTKVSWDGPPVPPRHGRNRQRFELAVQADDLPDEVDRLVRLGAARLAGAEPGAVELADPDGNEFSLRPSR